MNVKVLSIGLTVLTALHVAASGRIGFGEWLTTASAQHSSSESRPGKNKTIDVAIGDAEMAAAIKKARAGLAKFWAAAAQPVAGVGNFSLKVTIPHSNGQEHFWLIDIERKGSRFVGTINNDPNYAHHVKLGQRYEFGEPDISDWMFVRNGKIVGNETLRPLLKRMPKQQAEQYRAMLEKP